MKIRGFFLLLFLHLTGSVYGQAAPYTSRLQTLASGLDRPVLVRGAGDGSKRIFVVERTGIIKVIQAGSNTPVNFLDLSSKIAVPTESDDVRGLLGLTFHPNFAQNGKFYVDYTRSRDGAAVVAEYHTLYGNPAVGDVWSERILLTIPQPFPNHYGGMIEFGKDGYLYIGTGDGESSNDPSGTAQNEARLSGKMLRIEPNPRSFARPAYLIPTTNPFAATGATRCDTGSSTVAGCACPEIWATGLRNPWRWSFDRAGSNQLYAGDIGESTAEELDIITRGGNYGWRVYEGNSCTGLEPALCAEGTAPVAIIPPYFNYTHTDGRCAVIGGYVYRGKLGSLPTGAYTFADHCSGEIWMWKDNARALLQDTPKQIVSFGEDDDGEIYVCYADGQIDKIVKAKASADFDGDLKSDIAVYRPSSGTWFVIKSSTGEEKVQQFGETGDIVTPKDFDGDDLDDLAFFRPSDGSWHILQSSDSTVKMVSLGTNGDVPVAGDYDGDAKADPAVYRPSQGIWSVRNSTDGSISSIQLGVSGDKPVPGDYDGDGKCDMAVFRDQPGLWTIRYSSNQKTNKIAWGLSGDLAAPGDFDRDGRLDTAVFRPSTGEWYVLTSRTGFFYVTFWGTAGDTPVVGDYDGDGKDDVAIFRPSSATWYIQYTANLAEFSKQWGLADDVPVEAKDTP